MQYYFKIIEGKSAEELESNLAEFMQDQKAEFVTINFNVSGNTWRALITLKTDK